jgi:SAM-dependent methyltransferase
VRAVRLLEYAITKKPESVLDVGVGRGMHAFSFIANGIPVTGVDVRPSPLTHDDYNHVQNDFMLSDFGEDKYDMVWCCHTLEHVPNVQATLMKIRELLKDDGWLCIAVPTDRQNRFHVGHLTLWTPAHLIYNLICAGYDCKEAYWYSEYCTVGLIVQKKPDIDYSGRTGMPSEVAWLNQYTPGKVRHLDGAWWGNRWHEATDSRIPDPPCVTAGYVQTNLDPEAQLYTGPNPDLRKGYERSN